jgi:ParB-like nuclease domain
MAAQVQSGDRLESAQRLGRETISAEITTGKDASSSSKSEGPRRVNTTALLHTEGKTRPAAVRPQVRWQGANGTLTRKPRQKAALVDQGMAAEGTIVLGQVSRNLHIRELSFGEFEIGVPPIPLESADVESLRDSLCLVGQTTPVLVREFSDGRLALLDGWGRVEALRSMGRATISAIILRGLSDQEARLKQIDSSDIESFRQFKTIGPGGEHTSDINGKAAAIECYLDFGDQGVARWNNFNEGAKTYQGELVGKDRYKNQFLDQKSRETGYDYSKIETVLDLIVTNCVAISEARQIEYLETQL